MLIFRYSKVSGRFEISGVTGTADKPKGTFRPPVDISFRDRVFTVRIDLPGASPEDLSIEADEREVNIYGTVKQTDPPGPCRLIERPSGTFMRTLNFHGGIAPDKVTASLSGGVLTLVVPAPNLDRDPTRIEIRIDGAD
jgi:HSP20 family protein